MSYPTHNTRKLNDETSSSSGRVIVLYRAVHTMHDADNCVCITIIHSSKTMF